MTDKWTDLFAMLRDMQQHAASEEVTVSDDPYTLHIGYASPSRAWKIHLVGIKEAFNRNDLTDRELSVKDLFKTAAGRQALILHYPL